MNIGLAFSYITSDRDWIKKVLIGGLLSLIPIIGGLIVAGFMMRIMRNVANNDPEPLPEWNDFGSDLVNGFLGAVGAIVWTLPFIILVTCTSSISGAGGDEFGLIGLIGLCFGYPLLFISLLVITPIIYGRLITTGKFGSMFEFNEILEQVKRVGVGPYAMLIVLGIIAYFVAVLGLIACLIGVVFTAAFAQYAVAHGMGQIYARSTGGSTEYRAPAF